MRRLLFPLWFCLWPLFLGVFLPYCPLPGGHRLLNLPWEIVSGLVFWGIDETIGLSVQSRLLFAAAFYWPFVVSIAMCVLGSLLQKASRRKLRLISAVALIASSFFVVNLDRAMEPPLSNVPTYYRLFAAVW
jgi:hypothetical protein